MAFQDVSPRVLHVTTAIGHGGVENHLVDLIKGQQLAGYPAIACAHLKPPDTYADWFRRHGVLVEHLGMRFYGDPRPAVRLRSLIRRFNPDVLHVHGAPVEVYALVAAIAHRRPALVITRHEPRRRLFGIPGYDALDRLISSAADLIIAVSGSVLSEDVSRRPELRPKALTVHHGIDANFCRTDVDRIAMRNELGAGDTDILIGTVARHTSEKSLDTLLHAFRTCLDGHRNSSNLRLALIGQGPLTAELKRLAEELEIERHLAWFESRRDIPSVMQAFDIFALPSREEGFGIVLLEAMSCGRPIVACAVDAIPEIVVEGETGFLVPPRDPDAFASALARLISDPLLRERLGAAARDRVQRTFTIERMQQQTIKAYQRLARA